MKKVTRRLAAGVSAAALLVSAVGFDAFTDLIMRPASADDASSYPKTGKSTGFDNLEQDTDEDDNYNTGYGLHTNKTASVADGSTDGRTFDVGLESWYVGENPVDVATILDASGSMAWTVDTLEPLDVNNAIKAHPELDSVESLRELQEANGGYLPQSVVDLILENDDKHTDNSNLSYAGYQYYVYEERSSVSEFVPLGYWDGGTSAGAIEPIGYYPFEGSLVNEINGGTAKLIKHAEETDGTFDGTQTPTVTVEPAFSSGGDDLQLDKTAEKGALLADVSTTASFTISMRVEAEEVDLDKTSVNKMPFVYIGKEGGAFISIYRNGNGSDTYHVKVDVSDGKNKVEKFLNVDKVFQTQNKNGQGAGKKWVNISLSYDATSGKVSVNLSVPNGNGDTVFSEYVSTKDLSELDLNEADIIIGGDVVNSKHDLPYPEMLMTDFCVFDRVLTKDEFETLNTTDSENNQNIKQPNSLAFASDLTAYYDFNGGKLDNQKTGVSGSLTFIEQAQNGKFSKVELKDVPAKPVYTKDNGNQVLDLKKTAEKGAVLLDAMPDSSNYTLSFKMKIVKGTGKDSAGNDYNEIKEPQNIIYVGDGSSGTGGKYQTIFRRNSGSNNHIVIYERDNLYLHQYLNSGSKNDSYDGQWATITVTVSGGVGNVYVDGVQTYKSTFTMAHGELSLSTNNLTTLGLEQMKIILAGLWDVDNYKNAGEIYLDDVLVYNTALTSDQVKAIFGESDITTEYKGASDNHCHAVSAEDKALAQISTRLSKTLAPLRRGWYYVNSHSEWKDIEDCLKSGKQFIGIYDDAGIASYPDMVKDNVTLPSGMEQGTKDEIKKYEGDEASKHADYVPPTIERSIRFYVDGQDHLRCFVWSGSETKNKDDKRTFCSLVYEKNDKQLTKYEALNGALNDFYQKLAEYSDLSNTATVRFSTNNAVAAITDDDKTNEKIEEKKKTTNTNLKKLIMKDWTNYSKEYTDSSKKTERDQYLRDLLVPDAGETSVPDGGAEYPYVMTGGTYTWTGLKAFYDNMVDTKDKKSGDPAYDIANDARDKYLIIFTDGRDNTQDLVQKADGTNDYDNSTNYKKTNYVENYNPYEGKKHEVGSDNHDVKFDGDLAEAWADKLKDEGYTIYCVMLATGSISPTANEDEYNRAKNFLTTLAGANEGEERDLTTVTDKDTIDNYIRIVNNSSSALTDAFQQILENIQKPRKDYTVQDYIDPRFDLVDAGGNLYQLGANGNITVKNADGTTTDRTVENVIEKINETPTMTADECKALGLAYTPRESHMVNRKADPESEDGYDKGDGVGTGYLYYDDVKDMYYLRWTDQIIPMESESFDTGVEPNKDKYLEVWSATIRLKAKDDFIGGNNILTNGNEAGENLVYSDATIKNMDKGENRKLYGLKEGYTYRDKLEALSGTNRKINAVDADGVSQAVYGDGIDIPSSGFPRTTVNVRLLKLNAKNLNDVIYMGEVVSPTMMLADLENDYMTGSYYLEYLRRYAYRVYGYDAAKKPLIELLNQWLKIKIEEYDEKTFTIPYMYLPEPIYEGDTLKTKTDGGKTVVEVKNSTGMSLVKSDTSNDVFIADAKDLNLCDVTGFITYTWKREYQADEPKEEQQNTGKMDAEGNPIYDITKDYVAKSTNQIKYNLELKFTPLKKDAADLEGFKLDDNFIIDEENNPVDKFFDINGTHEFNFDGVKAWKIDFDRKGYLQAMVSEEKTYEPHVMYDKDAAGGGKWVLVDEESDNFKSTDAVKAYEDADKSEQTTDNSDGTVTDKGVYDWDPDYKPFEKGVQIEAENFKNYTDTPQNVNLLDAKGDKITDGNGDLIATATPCSLTANTTYTKDIVNAALALELFVDGKYLNNTDPKIKTGKTFTFIAERFYDDPIDPLPYDSTKTSIGADTGEVAPLTGKVAGKKYRLTFKVENAPADAKPNQIYQVWAKLTKVEVEVEGSTGSSKFTEINTETTEKKSYLGYEKPDALPIGTYAISVDDMNDGGTSSQYYLGEKDGGGNEYFEYLKTDSTASNYKYDKFPESVHKVSKDAATDTNDGEYLILNGSTDNSQKNIAKNDRKKVADTQTATFYFGTVESRKVGTETLYNTKGESAKDYLKEHPNDKQLTGFKDDYAKDRLGIIMLSADENSLVVTKEVKNTEKSEEKEKSWNFTITIETDDGEWVDRNPNIGYTLYSRESSGTWNTGEPKTATVAKTSEETVDGRTLYTLTIELKLTHNQKAIFNDLPSGTWQVEEVEPKTGEVLYTPHNNQSGWGDSWEYHNSPATDENTLTPLSQVDFVNEFPYALPSAGGDGINLTVYTGIVLMLAGGIWLILLRRKAHSRDKPSEGGCP